MIAPGASHESTLAGQFGSGLARLTGEAQQAQLPQRLAAVVLLHGSLRRDTLGQQLGRSIYDLPLTNQTTLLQHWADQVGQVVQQHKLHGLEMRLILGGTAQQPQSHCHHERVQVTLQADPEAWRGTGGVLRDALEDIDDEQFVLVAAGAQVLTQPLEKILIRLESAKADVAVLTHAKGRPASMYLIRRAALKHLPTTGFVDFKEQGLRQMAAHCRVKHVSMSHPAGLFLRDGADYLTAVRELAGHSGHQPVGALVEDSASVAASAKLFDSVVLAGAKVEAGAVVVRSIIAPGCVIKANERVVDRLLLNPACRGKQETQRARGLRRLLAAMRYVMAPAMRPSETLPVQ